MRITVLCGGPSDERDVSIRSGAAVAKALLEAGHDVFVSDVSPTDLSCLDRPADVIFPVLHGQFGESGELQEILEARGLTFVGSGSVASRLGMDKIEAKKVWRDKGLPTAPWQTLTALPPDPKLFGLPVVLKAIRSGSSIDVHICKTADEVTAAALKLLGKHDEIMMEQFVIGTELTVGLLDGVPLPPIRIVTTRETYDFEAKYNPGGSEHHFDLNLPADVVARCQRLAADASDALGCRDLGRVDLIVDQTNTPFLLEINTIPGFTSVSLLPDAAREAGLTFPQFVDKLARIARARAGHAVAAVA